MDTITDSEFADFLSMKPLYHKIRAVTNFEKIGINFSNPIDYNDKPFKFKCPIEKETQTFRTKLFYNSGRYIYSEDNLNEIPNEFDEKTRALNITFHLVGICQSCKTLIHFLINAQSDTIWEEREKGLNIIIQKVGQIPPYNIAPDKDVEKYLTIEDIENYNKALINLSVSYGIGAYAYFRRIIENEIKRIIEDISKIEFEGSEKLKAAIGLFETNHQMSNLIDVANKFIPNTFLDFGDNPIRLLYEQLSDGIHKLTDEQCLDNAQSINTLLKFIIKKINEEKFTNIYVREAMKKLRKEAK